MTSIKKYVLTGFLMTFLMVIGCTSEEKVEFERDSNSTSKLLTSSSYNLYKSESCGCCEEWMEYMSDKGYHALIHHPENLTAVKSSLGIDSEHQSCHTAVFENGYVMEGHVPAKFVTQFMNNPPDGALGLAVPGMPVGSPGMEMEGRFKPYNIYLLKKDGSTEVYASVESADQQ